MNELAETLARYAAGVDPVANLADVYRRADRRRRRAHRARIALVAFTAVAAVGALLAVTGSGRAGDGSATPPPAAPTSVPPAVLPLGGLLITGAGVDASYRHATLDRSDAAAGRGPYAVVVRRVDGRLGTASAVVTYPVPDDVQGDGEVHTDYSTGTNLSTLVASRPGGRVLVRAAGLAAGEVVSIASVTSVVDGRPVVSASEAMVKYAVVATGTLRPPIVSEARYGCDALGEGGTLGGLCYTGLAASPGFENALYEKGFEPGPLVNGHLSVVSTLGGGNATLAWEPQPGVVAYVGYSGNGLGRDQIDALARLATRTTLDTPAEWAATRPDTVAQTNGW